MAETETGLAVVEEALARLAILEDVGEGDLTAAAVPETARAVAVVRAREPGVVSGVGAAVAVFQAVDAEIEVEALLAPGDPFDAGTEILRASGSVRSLLTVERSVLNFLQHLSGVATATARFVRAVATAGTGVRITDTRKTIPGLRLLEKEAVLHGGGVNHRLGLYDAVMIKDNHIDAAGGIRAAVDAVRVANPRAPIIVEARNPAEAEEAARMGVGRVLLDNMSPDQVAACVDVVHVAAATVEPPAGDEERWLPGTWRPGDCLVQIEVSGGVTLDSAVSYALPGVDFLAVGALTHSARAVDLTMDLERISS